MSGPSPSSSARARTSADDVLADVRLLEALLAAVHAAVHGYGVLGARLDETARATALRAHDAARARRDALAARLRERGATPAPALPAYDVEVDTPQEALALAVRLEEGLAVRWRDLVAGTDDLALRRLGVEGLQEAAVRAAVWRELSGAEQVTVALPGTLQARPVSASRRRARRARRG